MDAPLTIYYDDGSTRLVKRECGRQKGDRDCSRQTGFTDIQISEDRQRIGWAADYLMCAQSYPCSVEVAVLSAGQLPRYFHGASGVVWQWSFWKGGSQVILHSGFPHGDDTGYFLLFDGDTGRHVQEYTPGRTPVPAWVAYLQNSKRTR